ncbi:hypothetical protein U1Q18_037199, partial [Sarracenia purpurea var. burkii]
MMKRPMAIPEVILELQDKTLRESAIRSLSTFLLEAREPEIIKWALESNMVEVCQISMEIGSELSKV